MTYHCKLLENQTKASLPSRQLTNNSSTYIRKNFLSTTVFNESHFFQRERETERDRDRQRERETDRETKIETHEISILCLYPFKTMFKNILPKRKNVL